MIDTDNPNENRRKGFRQIISKMFKRKANKKNPNTEGEGHPAPEKADNKKKGGLKKLMKKLFCCRSPDKMDDAPYMPAESQQEEVPQPTTQRLTVSMRRHEEDASHPNNSEAFPNTGSDDSGAAPQK